MKAEKKKGPAPQVNRSAYVLLIGALSLRSLAYDTLKEEMKEVK